LAAVYPLEFDSGLEPFGIIRNVSPRISGLFDQGKKGIQSGANFLVLHTTPETSRELWDDAADEVLSELWAEALDALPRIYKKGPARALPVNSILHKWRYCEPVQPLSIPYASSGSSLFLAGDAFIGARVEGAFESGRQAAHALIRERQRR
jgi:predicted NAD/FAD-dependent oxidoreductase